jgi:large subunit ribosomal protein L6
MAKIDIEQTITVPEGCQAQIEEKLLTVTGPKGSIKRKINGGLKISLSNNQVILLAKKVTKREKKLIFTQSAHIKNMIRGVTEGFVYKLKICSGHFPMNVSVKGDSFEVKNFIGETVPRTLMIKEGATVKINGDIIEVEGSDKEVVAQQAASIEQLTRRPGYDKRRFQDGIYIIDKSGRPIK